jgi:hypothetical protein
VHLNELDNTGGSSVRQLGGSRPWGRREAESGKGIVGDVNDAGKQSRGRGLPARSTMPGSRVEGGGAPAMVIFGSLTA